MEHINLVKKIAWSFNKTTGIEFEELFSEACLHYCEALKTYDPSKGVKLTTYLYCVIQNSLRNYVDKHHVRKPNLVSMELIKKDPVFNVNWLFESCSEDALEIAKIVLKGSKPFLNLSPKQAHIRIANILRKNGWDMPRIWVGIRELHEALSYN